MIIKTRSDAIRELARTLNLLHSYDLPEFITFEITGGNVPYLKWLDRAVQK